MNANSKGRSQITTSRLARGIGAAALSTILVVGLAGCMTGRVVSGEQPAVERNAVAPVGIDRTLPADRIVEQLDRQAAANRTSNVWYAGHLANRADGKRTGTVNSEASTNPHPGMSADNLERLLLQAK